MQLSKGRVKNPAAENLLDDTSHHLEQADDEKLVDPILLADTQKIEHYCIAAWGTVRSLGRLLERESVVEAMEQVLKEGKRFDEELTKGSSGNKRAIWRIGIRCDGVVPFTVEFGTFDVDRSHFGVGDDDATGVLASVELAVHGEAGFGGRGRDRLDDCPIADQRLGAPILADEGEEAVLDFVPLAGAGRQGADHDVEAELVGQLLQFAFPQPHPRAIAAAAIGGDQQPDGVGVTRPPEVEPPLADAVDREGGCVMVDTDAHPSGIRRKIIDAIGTP